MHTYWQRNSTSRGACSTRRPNQSQNAHLLIEGIDSSNDASSSRWVRRVETTSWPDLSTKQAPWAKTFINTYFLGFFLGTVRVAWGFSEGFFRVRVWPYTLGFEVRWMCCSYHVGKIRNDLPVVGSNCPCNHAVPNLGCLWLTSQPTLRALSRGSMGGLSGYCV